MLLRDLNDDRPTTRMTNQVDAPQPKLIDECCNIGCVLLNGEIVSFAIPSFGIKPS